MSDPSETSGRPLASTIQQLEGITQQQPQPSLRPRRRRDSHSSDERVGGTKSIPSRRRLGVRKEASIGPHTGSSRADSSTMQRSTSPTQMSPAELAAVHYTRTGRISKAKKGLKVHNCQCGRSYTRAEHLRRHQKNHAQDDALVCEFQDCGKTFYRLDLLQRHQERHTEVGKDSRRSSFNQGTPSEQGPQVLASVALSTPVATTHSQQPPYYPQAISPLPESAPNRRYSQAQFRTPQMPSSAFGHVLRSSPSSKSHPNHLKQHRSSYSARGQASVTIPVEVGGLPTGIAWNDPFSQSPNYSSSSGYASPIPSAGDYANMFANPPYGAASNRTRTSSNASYIEPWGYPSRSPTSATSTLAYTWTANDKSPAPPHLPFMATTSSYPMTSIPMSAGIDPMHGFGHFGSKSIAQRDEEEQGVLFPEQSFGMGHITNTYPFEQYLDNYWRLFHPTFPAVHRASFDGMNESSPMLRAAMIAVGAQFSNDTSAKRKSRILHDRCVKLLEKRGLEVITEPDRMCDYQALLLVEVLSQYRARRAAKTLSSRFEGLYHRFSQEFRGVTSAMLDIVSSITQPQDATYDQWARWVDLASRQRLLLCCYILEYQQAIFLARDAQPSMIQFSGFDMPFPAHSSLWNATGPTDWALAAQQHPQIHAFVYEITPDTAIGPLDLFQSSLLIAAHYNHLSNSAPYLSPPSIPMIDHHLDTSPMTKHQLLTAKLLQVTPIRALLAVSGESWIFSEKVPSPQAFANFKSTLKTWVSGLWATASDTQYQSVRDAIRIALELLQHAVAAPPTLRLDVGADLGIYFATLVVWAVTVAANSRIIAAQGHGSALRFPSHSPLPSNRNSNHFPSTPTHLSTTSQSVQSPNPMHPSTPGLIGNIHTSPIIQLNSQNMFHPDITTTSINFIGSAMLDLDLLGLVPQWPRDAVQWQQGCSALLRWVKMWLRNGIVVEDLITPTPPNAGNGRGGDGLGELLDGVIGVLDKVIKRGWEGWGI
ncbi:hypothetical protein P154DRAFT_423278 [Amniculicola lignicola CBS 123094]|uniref:C2H2-type domain-containing protein n=1 Tax=Amniculicola lignicola CBS 123094 TaxID=1392246 RepID=A0A6A5WWS7_9PLEO|nr:hypothetical protein P154DRAFT_423278 [Amniculicola lignicola CBS 123094]